jgi:enterobacterial common antigen flippase
MWRIGKTRGCEATVSDRVAGSPEGTVMTFDVASERPVTEKSAESSGSSHASILKSTAIIGGASLVNVAFAIVRNKTIALLLGPHGVGLVGLYGSIADLTQTLAALGIQQSGVRQIAEATATGDEHRVARTALVLRRVTAILGIFGSLLLAFLASPVANFTFGDSQHSAAVTLLSVAIFFRLLYGGQVALVQGMRRLSDLARINMLAALSSTIVSIAMVYLLGPDGIVPSFVAMAVIMVIPSWWYSRKLRTSSPFIGSGELGRETATLLKLGIAFMGSTLLSFGAGYAVRIIVLKTDGIGAAGLYQSAWALGGLYVGFILQAMVADFYPRLTAVAQNNTECNRLVNEQAQISILLAGPGVIATLMAAPLVIRLFYTPDFYPAITLLRWICLGMMLRVVAWPMGMITIAKGARQIFFWAEMAATVVHVGLAGLFVPRFGVVGAGAAFFGLYVWHTLFIYLIVRRLSGFRWSDANLSLGLIFLPACGSVFAAFLLLPPLQANLVGAAIVIGSGLYSLRRLLILLPAETMPKMMRRWRPAATIGSS